MEKELKMFNDFISNYDLTVDAIKMKEEHTYRVVEYAREIAKSLSLSDEDINLACICALFHDLGRFPQYSEYHTFHDSLSFDHGDKSYEILKELNYNDEIVLKAVKYHNKYKVDDSLTEREKLFANITRDADKLDIIFDQLNDEYQEDYKITDQIMYYFYNKEMTPNNFENGETASRLRELAFIFDINFKKSYEILKESNIINNKIDTIYNSIKDERIFEIRDILNERIDEKC